MRRRWLAPEVVQTSAMDCGPAALKCLLEGHGIAVGYGRLREACRTDLDGTSIDVLEQVAPRLGLGARQLMLPADFLTLPSADGPALLVARRPDGATHFVVLWRRVGPWLQLMDPARGRRWLHRSQLAVELFRHELPVAAADWRAWAGSPEFLQPLAERLAALGLGRNAAQALADEALADPGWFGLGSLDAAVRATQALVAAGGLPRGAAAAAWLRALLDRTRATPDDIFATLAEAEWSVVPELAASAGGTLHLALRGAVLLRLEGRVDPGPAALPRELQAALAERPPGAARLAREALDALGPLRLAALVGAVVAAAALALLEALLLRAALDLGGALPLAGQRLAAGLALGVFMLGLLAIEWPLAAQALALGQALELALRRRLHAKLRRLDDRYFQSRPVSDMAERSHGLVALRQAPGLLLRLMQGLAECLLTLAGIAWIAPAAAPWALAMLVAAVGLPLALLPWLGERDQRQRTHAAAMHGAHFDALVGAVPLRVHHAAGALAGRHEALLAEWQRSGLALARAALGAQALQQGLAMALAGGLLASHFRQAGGIGGADLLLVYWTIKLPAIGQGLAQALQQWPAQRNVAARLAELLQAPEEPVAAPLPAAAGPVGLAIAGGTVLAGGHPVLQGLELRIAPGEQVAVVGASGAGKSSLVGLLLGWHRLSAGTLQVDGRPLDAAGLEALRRRTAWVDPAVQLWDRPLLDNLIGDGATPGAAPLAPVLAAAELRGLVERLPEGLQTPLGENGGRLSGGEGQRVRLARAMLQRDVGLVLLDEPLRGLDRAQRHRLLGAARRWWQGATLLCVTHDVRDTLDFDRVLVVDAGRIVEDGPPAALLARDGAFAALLAADRALQASLWSGRDWRRLRLAEGRLTEPGPPA